MNHWTFKPTIPRSHCELNVIFCIDRCRDRHGLALVWQGLTLKHKWFPFIYDWTQIWRKFISQLCVIYFIIMNTLLVLFYEYQSKVSKLCPSYTQHFVFNKIVTSWKSASSKGCYESPISLLTLSYFNLCTTIVYLRNEKKSGFW